MKHLAVVFAWQILSLLSPLLLIVRRQANAFLVVRPWATSKRRMRTSMTAGGMMMITSSRRMGSFSFLPEPQHGATTTAHRRRIGLSPSSSSIYSSTTPSSETSIVDKYELTEQQMDFCLGYLNKHHSKFLLSIATSLSVVADEMAKANAWSGGSYTVLNATASTISTETIVLDLIVQKRGDRTADHNTRRVDVSLNPSTEIIANARRRLKTVPPPVLVDLDRLPIDDVCRKLSRLAWMAGHPDVSGKLMQLAVQLDGAGIGKLPENMYLNQVPHNRYVRQYFYDTAARAIRDAVMMNSSTTRRMKVVVSFPETNPSMDSYRIGTLLELVRTAAITLAKESKQRIRICVQGSMGVGIFTGVPKQLSGVSKLVQMMDWQSGEGELCEGIVGEYIRFGAVGPQHVQDDDDCFLIVAPQSMVGSETSIFPLLKGMVDAAGHQPVILLNPDLTDRVSAAGQQSVRGRQERIDFAESFETIYEFSNIYVSGASYFPILGAMTKLHPSEPWIAHQRRDYQDAAGNKGEIYVPVLSSESKPDGEAILEYFEK